MKGAMRLLAALVLAAGTAHAQEDQRRHDREEAFRMVDAYVVSHLQESLGLSDEQFAKAVPLVTKLQRERREYLMESLFLNTVKYENDKLEAYMRKLTK